MRLHKNISIWYLTTFFSYAAFTLPIWVIFNTDILGLSNTQAFILGVLPYGLSAIFEVPTGSWADRYGRARVYRLGTVLYILSVASYIFFPYFYILFFFQVLGGIGLAMQSGSLEALVHDSLRTKNKDVIYAQIHARKMAILFTSRVLTVLLSGWMFTINPRLPFVIAVGTYIVGLLLSMLFEEVRLETPARSSHYQHIKETFLLMLNKSTLVFFSALVAIYIFLSEALFALYQPYFQSLHINIGKFGIFYAIISMFSAIGALFITTLSKRHNVFTILCMMILAVLFTLTTMLSEMPVLIYLAIVPSSLAFGLVITLQNTITQKLIGSKHQATAISIASFIRTFPFLISVIGVGIMLDVMEVRTLNQILAGVTAICCLPFILGLKSNNINEY